MRLFPFSDFTYLLQLEEYQTGRYLALLPQCILKSVIQNRGRLVATQRARVIRSVALLMWFGLFINAPALTLLTSPLLIPLIIPIANLLIGPYYAMLKNSSIKKAKAILSRRRPIVVCIAGSYGKTTVKNFLFQILEPHRKTLMVPGNINSTIGIANWLMYHWQTQSHILIAEADGYAFGRIAKTTALLQPNYAVLTNIGDQHVERFGTRQNLARSLLELFTHAPSDCCCLTGSDTGFLDDCSRDLERVGESCSQPHLSSAQNKSLDLAIAVAKKIGLTSQEIDSKLSNLTVPARRGMETTLFGFWAIDDSYNISFNTALATLEHGKQLAAKKNRKIIVIVAGIPELAKDQKDKNRQLGSRLEQVADQTFILQSIYAKEIEKGFKDKNKCSYSFNFKSAIEKLSGSYEKKEYLLIVFPELNDLYY